MVGILQYNQFRGTYEIWTREDTGCQVLRGCVSGLPPSSITAHLKQQVVDLAVRIGVQFLEVKGGIIIVPHRN